MKSIDENDISSDFQDESEENTAPIKITNSQVEDNQQQVSPQQSVVAPESTHNALVPEQPSGLTKKVRNKRGLTILLGLLAVILLTVGGAGIGYLAAVNARQAQAQEEAAYNAATQFQLGILDIEAGRYEIAKQRFEFVLQIDPTFPGAVEKLTDVMRLIAQQTTPTITQPTATIAPSPTIDTRPTEELFNAAQSYLRSSDWVNAIATIEALRTADLTYRAIDVDGMYYIALRGRGINKIIQDGNLEGGIYDLSLVERFGPLDNEAVGYRAWARAYLQGASFWKVDWEKVVSYFSQVYPTVPNLRDADGWTAAERYRYALVQYGDALLALENFCSARDQYRLALSIADDPALGPTATFVQLKCEPPTATPAPATPTIEVTIDSTPTVEVIITTEPTVEVTATP